MNKNFFYYLLLGLSLLIVLFLCLKNNSLRNHNAVLLHDLSEMTAKCTKLQLNDSISCMKVKGLELSNRQFEETLNDFMNDNDVLRKELKRIKNTALSSSTISMRDIVYLCDMDTVYVPNVDSASFDTCIFYTDDYVNFTVCPDYCIYRSVDTLHQIITKKYKHKFLWFNWGLEGFYQYAWNSNPNTEIVVDKFLVAPK